MEVTPDLTGVGLFNVSSLLGLITIGSGLFPGDSCVSFNLRSNKSTSDVVGAIGVESVGFSFRSLLVLRFSLSLRGLGATAGRLDPVPARGRDGCAEEDGAAREVANTAA